MRIRRFLMGFTLVIATVPLWVEPGGATVRDLASPVPPATTTTAVNVEAECVYKPAVTDPFTQGYTVVVTVPKRVSPGGTARIHVAVDFAVAPSVTAGAVSVVAHQGDNQSQQFIAVAANSPKIEGSASFPVTGAVGSVITWEFQYFGQTTIFGGSSVSEVCTPTAPVVIPTTKISHLFLSRSPALARLVARVCGGSRSDARPFAFLCALKYA